VVDHREVLYATPLSVSSTWTRITSPLLEFPDVRARKIEQCLVEDAPLDVPLAQVLDDVLFAAWREHRHERRVTDFKVYGKRPVLALVYLLAALGISGLANIVGEELDLRVLIAQSGSKSVDLLVGLDALRVLDPT
jgi:hypothetical protein